MSIIFVSKSSINNVALKSFIDSSTANLSSLFKLNDKSFIHFSSTTKKGKEDIYKIILRILNKDEKEE